MHVLREIIRRYLLAISLVCFFYLFVALTLTTHSQLDFPPFPPWSTVSCSHTTKASTLGSLKRIQVLLAEDPSLLNRQNKDGWSPLMYASATGQDKVVDFLLANPSIQVDLAANDKTTALMQACISGHETIMYSLLQRGANPNCVDETGVACIHKAVLFCAKPCARLLLKAGCNIDVPHPISGNTPLMEACRLDCPGCTQFLLKHGANANAKNKAGQSPLYIAQHPVKTTIVNILQMVPGTAPKRSDATLAAPPGLKPPQHQSTAPQPLTGPAIPADCRDVETLLNCLNLKRFIPLFTSQNISFDALTKMTEADLKAIGMSTFGSRRKLFSAIQFWLKQQQAS
eukprot:m.164605 g.164605  ORF g.164605 m.164605 type:complete len:343 (+) comp14402_c0_seq3:32-1060(+)